MGKTIVSQQHIRKLYGEEEDPLNASHKDALGIWLTREKA